MKTVKIVAVCLVVFILIIFAELASAQERIEYTTINIVGLEVVQVTGPANQMEEAWLNIYIGASSAQSCPEGTPQLTISTKIVYEIYVDEYLIEETPGYLPCGNAYDAVGGKEMVDMFSDTIEPMLQYEIIPLTPITISGLYDGWSSLYAAMMIEMENINESMCFIDDDRFPGSGQWYASCYTIHIPITRG